jgi:hypothetical protein
VGVVEQFIRRAVKVACDHLIPKGLDSDLWKSFGPMERFYIKAWKWRVTESNAVESTLN